MTPKIPIAVIGATGYTGAELVRLLSNHPRVQIGCLTSQQYVGQKFSDIFPFFRGRVDLICEKLQLAPIAKKIKTAFLCLPHHEAMSVAAGFRSKGVKVIDLSADFRLKNAATYEKWYGKHSQKALLREAVYGIPELHREEIKKARLIASPGCYPTSVILGLAPLVAGGMIDLDSIICDSKSGTSGAGRGAKVENLFCEIHDNFRPYNIGKHRHLPEMEQELSKLAGEEVHLLFSPHLLPIDRGIISTIYATPQRRWSSGDLIQTYKKFYRKEKFIRILPEGVYPSTKGVRGTNYCDISILSDSLTDKVVVISAIDNLTKGASGQALQSFNIMWGFPEIMGLEKIGLNP